MQQSKKIDDDNNYKKKDNIINKSNNILGIVEYSAYCLEYIEKSQEYSLIQGVFCSIHHLIKGIQWNTGRILCNTSLNLRNTVEYRAYSVEDIT